jgi:adenosylcobinamide-GDP ribazoletransferase
VAASPAPTGPASPDPSAARGRLAGLRLALAFLTVVPVRIRGDAPPLGAAAGWFPLVGGLLGALAGGVDYLARRSLGSSVAAILAVGVLVVLTGGLHQDGLADCADGLGVRGDRVRRLAVMRDSSIGTFGALALLFWLALIVAGLTGLDRSDATCALVVAASGGRWAGVLHAATAPAARPDGLGAAFAPGRPALALSSATTLALGVALLGIDPGIAAVAAAATVGLLSSAWSRRALGGRTGDTLGACVSVAEVAVVLVALALAGR